MGLKFNDENQNQDQPENKQDDLLNRLRGLIKSTEGVEKNLSDPEYLEKVVGKDNAAAIGRVQKRIDELTDAAHVFLDARAKGDPTEAMANFMRIIQDTCIKFSPIEIGSIMSTGMVALATLEKSFGIKPPSADDTDDGIED